MLQADDIRYIVVHCSDTPDEDGLGAADIHAMHLGFGWDGAGYHAIITRDGICHPGRPEYWQGAHVKGRNHDSVGVCLIGRSNFTPDQCKQTARYNVNAELFIYISQLSLTAIVILLTLNVYFE